MNSPNPSRIGWLLQPSRAFLVSLFLALVITLPTLKLGFFSDDYYEIIAIEGVLPSQSSRFDLYKFAPSTLDGIRASIERGELPWWTQPDIKLHFFRPLSSALVALDHSLFGRAPLGYHVHAIVWYLAIVAAAGLFFRRALPGATGAAALLLFAIDDGHLSPVGWISARHILVSTAPAVLGLWAHLRYREEGWKPGRWLSFAGIAVGLLGGETALGAIAYWLAYEFAAPQDGEAAAFRARLRRAAPMMGFSFVYLAVYKVLGYGIRGSDLYIEPFSSPRAFALGLMERVPILVGDLLGGLLSDPTMAVRRGPFIVYGVVAAVGFVLFYRATLPFIPAAERRALQWIVPGALLSLLTVSGGVLAGRVLLMPSLGSAALVATLLRYGLGRAGEAVVASWRGLRWVGVGAVAFVHVGLAALIFAALPFSMLKLENATKRVARETELSPSSGQQVFVLAGSDPIASFYSPLIRTLDEPGRIAGWHVLSLAKHPHRVTRTGPSSFRLKVVDGRFLEAKYELFYRSVRAAFAVGDEVATAGARVTIRAVEGEKEGVFGGGGRPTEIEVQFDRPLEDAGLSFVAWQGNRFRRVAFPEVGGSIDLPWELGPTKLF